MLGTFLNLDHTFMLHIRHLVTVLSIVFGFTFISAAFAASPPLPTSQLKDGVETFNIACLGNPQQTTIGANDCLRTKRAQVEAIEDKYVSAVHQRIEAETDSPTGHVQKTLNAFDAENIAWGTLINKASQATATDWEGGTIRGIMGGEREIELVELRIHNQWENWLTFMDSTPAVLPEPKFKNIE